MTRLRATLKGNDPVTVVCAAVLLNGSEIHSLPRPARHHTILHKLADEGIDHRGAVQGFLLDTGSFVTRAVAAECAIAAGQIKELAHPPYLYSEDLW